MTLTNRLYFIRHGESVANQLGIFSNRPPSYPLTEAGVLQVQALAARLQKLHVASIWASTLLRAQQTAQIIAGTLGCPYQTTDALREYDCGILEGRSDQEAWQLYHEVSDAWMLRQEWERRMPEGESLRDMADRFTPFVKGLLQASNATGGDLLLIAHGGLYRCMLPVLLGNISWAFANTHRLNYAEVVVARVGANGLFCERWGDTLFPPETDDRTPP